MQMLEMFYDEIQDAVDRKVPFVIPIGTMEDHARHASCGTDTLVVTGCLRELEKEKEIVGYGMIAKSFSTEFGKPCIWIEDLYLKEGYRGEGIGSSFFQYFEREYPNTIMRLEVEEENKRAVAVYRKNGYETLPYMEMKKEI